MHRARAWRAFSRAISLGLILRCPACEQGHLYRSFFDIHARCDACGRDFDADGEYSGAVALVQGAWAVVAIGGLFPFYVLGAPLWIMIAWAAATGLALPLATYRNVKGAWVGIVVGGEELARGVH
ncbi:MAG: DUF983 domain-containing protein [Thermoplasmatota archaeon]